MGRWAWAVTVALTMAAVTWGGDGEGTRAEGPARTEETAARGGEGSRLRFFEEVEVRERWDDLVGVAASSSEGTTGREQLERRPILRIGELAETVPGLIATQHSGGGKGNQYYLRGFNLDHGTDLSITVDGVPVNMPSHGHGQGFADLNFLIPEVIERVRFRKGPYFAEAGDFSAAGGIDIDLVDRLPEGRLAITLGGFGYRRLMAAESFGVSGGTLTAAVEASHHDGPWDRPDDYRKLNGMLRYVAGDGAAGWSVTAMGYGGRWLATDQVPLRAVRSGLLGRYGLVDPDPRGDTLRTSVSVTAHRGTGTTFTSLVAYAVRYELDLFSNFTYYLEDPVLGDEFEQEDRRWIGGLALAHRWTGSVWGVRAEHAAGVQVRHDWIHNGLYRTAGRRRLATTRRDVIRQIGAGAWVETWLHPREDLRVGLGARLDHYGAEVEAHRPENSGTASDWLASPKLSVAWRAGRGLELYLSGGGGFHSNDARGATIRVDPVSGEPVPRVDALVRAWGADVGARWHAGGLHSSLTAFVLELDSELLFVGDGGTTEASRPSRRMGLEWTNYWQLLPGVDVDLDVTWTDARFTDGDPAGDRIPGAIETTVASGITVDRGGPWYGTLRLRYFSGGALTEDGSVRWGPTTLLNGRIGLRVRGGLDVVAEGFNLLDSEDYDIAYFYVSRLPGEPGSGVADVHVHPVERRSFRLGVLWRF